MYLVGARPDHGGVRQHFLQLPLMHPFPSLLTQLLYGQKQTWQPLLSLPTWRNKLLTPVTPEKSLQKRSLLARGPEIQTYLYDGEIANIEETHRSELQEVRGELSHLSTGIDTSKLVAATVETRLGCRVSQKGKRI